MIIWDMICLTSSAALNRKVADMLPERRDNESFI